MGSPGRRQAQPQPSYAEFEPLPPMAVVRGAEEPLARFKEHLRNTPAARAAAGRKRRPAREPAGLPARQPSGAAGVRLAGGVPGQRRKARHRHRAAEHRVRLARGRHRLRHRDRAVRRRPDHAPAQEAGAGQRRRGADQGPVGAQRRRPGGAHAARHRPLQGPGQPGPGPGRERGRLARRAGIPAPRIRRQGHALCAGEPAAPDQPLHRRLRRRGAAAQAGLGPVGKGQAQGRRTGARHRRRAAQHLRPPRRARGPRVPLLGAGLRSLRQRLRLRGNRRPERRHPRRDPGHDLAAADGPAGVRRRRLRQDRGGPARGVRRGDRRQAGGVPGAHHAAGRAALPDAGGPLRQVAGEDRRGVALPLRQGSHRHR